MNGRRLALPGVRLTIFFLLLAGPAVASSIVQNGSLEDPNGDFANTACNYMALGAGSTTIPGWTVSPATLGELVWGKTLTCDGASASEGSFFVDLTGFGSNSPNGAIQQQLTTTPGVHYLLSLDLASFNNGEISVSVGTQTLALTAGAPSGQWTPHTATFTGDPMDTNPTLTIMIKTPSPGQNAIFLDNITVTGSEPVPATSTFSLSLLGGTLAVLLAYGWRRRWPART